MLLSQGEPAQNGYSTSTVPKHSQKTDSRVVVFCAGQCIKPQSAKTDQCRETVILDETPGDTVRFVSNSLISAPDYIALEDSGKRTNSLIGRTRMNSMTTHLTKLRSRYIQSYMSSRNLRYVRNK